MKDRFIKKDGMLFMRCNPEPLEKDSEMPCIVRLIRDGRLGRLNEQIHGFSFRNEIESVMTDDEMPHFAEYLAYEIVATHCPEGSVEWALWKMLNGEMVAKDSFVFKKSGEDKISCTDTGDGWREFGHYMLSTGEFVAKYIAKGDCFEPCEDVTLINVKVGDWVVDWDGSYSEIQGIGSSMLSLRGAGEVSTYTMPIKAAHVRLAPASLNPDFSKAKVGDEVFRMDDGYKKITVIDGDDIPIYAGNSWFDVRGFPCSPHKHEHPTLFHSHHQAKAYCDELFMRLDEEEKKDV